MAAIPRTAHWRLVGLPKTLTQAEVERFLAAFDRTRPTGLRDYAITRCLTDLGLRAIEVSGLRLEDVDWGNGTLAIHGKGRRVDLLAVAEGARPRYCSVSAPRTATKPHSNAVSAAPRAA